LAEFLPGYEASVWFGIAAPKGTPSEIVERLNAAINAGLAHDSLSTRLADLGGTLLPGSAVEFEWSKLVRAANLRPE
jgi:tripartite-type tricarboxylate transporter receptor subunit TctC